MAVSLENPLAYCREKVCPEVSSLHYATLFQTDEFKAFWLGCFTLNHELRQACLKQMEAGPDPSEAGLVAQCAGRCC
jgi:hypothetical protein